MKKIFSVLIALIISLASMTTLIGCGGDKDESKTIKPIEAAALSKEVGNFLEISTINGNQKAVVSGKGMNGSEGRINYHSNANTDSYLSEKQDFIFDIGRIEQLGEMHIWNYNELEKTNNGLKDVDISYSVDNVTFSTAKAYTFKQANGSAKLNATNLVDDTFVDFNGVSARYIKLSPKSNYGGASYGLSEVRLYRFKPEVKEGAYISAQPFNRLRADDGTWIATNEDYNTTNGSGMSDATSPTATHDNNNEHMSLISKSALGFKFDLNGFLPVKKIVIWNYNGSDLTNGVKTFKLKSSEDGTSYKNISTKAYTLPQGTGAAALAPSLVIELDNQVQCRYIMLETSANYGGNNFGLSEVRFYLGDGWFADDAPDYSAMMSNYDGWSGADGIYSVNLDGKDYDPNRKEEDKKTHFIFSDSIISQVNDETKIRKGVYMPNNTSASLTGGKPLASNMDWVYPKEASQAANIIPSPSRAATYGGKNKYYWLGDTFVANNKVYVFSLEVDYVDPKITGFGFDQTGVDLAVYDIKNGEVDYSSLKTINDTNKVLCDSSNKTYRYYFGGAVLENTTENGAMAPDGYIYIYGYLDKPNVGRSLVVSRVKPSEIENFSKYEFLSANDTWSSSRSDLKLLSSDSAPEVSVTPIRTGTNAGKYLLTNTHYTVGSDIKMSISDSPYGTFTGKTTVFQHDDAFVTIGKGNNSYNAKAHPALSKPGELLVSFNINGDDCFEYADIYRPRFFKIAQIPKV